MKYILILLFLTVASHRVLAQDEVAEKINKLVNEGDYSTVIDQYASKANALSASALYYVGLAYYMREEDNNCLKFMDLSLAKDATAPLPHFIKGQTLYYTKQYDDAVKSLQSAVALDATNGGYYTLLGEVYFAKEKYPLAAEAYTKALQQEEHPDKTYNLLAETYLELREKDRALETYYLAKQKNDTASLSYRTALFNIGLLETESARYDKAMSAYTEQIKRAPEDFHAYAKVIQLHYRQKEYSKAEPLRKQLYAAHNKGLLKDNLKNMFCFDQFTWEDKQIQAYEVFKIDTTTVDSKHLFYILNSNDEIQFRIQTEYSPISVELGSPKYILCSTKGNSHATYNVGFHEDFKYDELKSAVIAILEGKLTPAASSVPTK